MQWLSFVSPSKGMAPATISRDKVHGLWVLARSPRASRVADREDLKKLILKYLFKRCVEIDIKNLSVEEGERSLQQYLTDFIWFDSPKGVVYEGQQYAISARRLNMGAAIPTDPHVPPTIFPFDPRKVTYVYKKSQAYVWHTGFQEHVEQRAGRDSVIFKGQTLCLCRGIGEDEFARTGPNITSMLRADRCVVNLPMVENWHLKAPFSLKELNDAVWMLQSVKRTGFRLKTFLSLRRGFRHGDVSYLELSWKHTNWPMAG